MNDLFAARIQMGTSMVFHIIFAVVGIAMPLMMVLAEWRYQRSGEVHYLHLAKRWMRGTAIMFAVGAVSGTVLSFELGLLWPNFMKVVGPIISLPFTLEGFAFFLEAIFLGIYIYGWDRISPGVHLFAGAMVGLCGMLSGAFVVCANAWMNTPTGFQVINGTLINIDPWAAMFNPATATEVSHMTVAAYQSVAFAVVAIHAWGLLKRPDARFHLAALKVALPIAVVTALVQPVIGDFCAKMVAEYQPVKLAAMEAHWDTQAPAPMRLGGWPDEQAEVTRYAIEIPGLLSLLAYGDLDAEVMGLKQVPVDQRPPVAPVHYAFQVMVFAGSIMMLTALVALWLWFRAGKTLPTQPFFLKLLILNGPLGFLALETGWMVTEIGRQPYIVQGFMLTRDAVTKLSGLWITCISFVVIYLFLGLIVYQLLKRQVFATLEEGEV